MIYWLLNIIISFIAQLCESRQGQIPPTPAAQKEWYRVSQKIHKRFTTNAYSPLLKTRVSTMGEHFRSELLCFIVSRMNVIPTCELIEQCANHYDEAAIMTARALLFAKSKETNIRDSGRRGDGDSFKKLTLEDIVRKINELGSDVPTFYAVDLNNLPPYTMNSIDVYQMIGRVRDLSSRIQSLREDVRSQQRRASQAPLAATRDSELETIRAAMRYLEVGTPRKGPQSHHLKRAM